MARRALVIGNNYVGSPAELSGCVNDARQWAAYLAGRGFAVDVLPNMNGADILSHLRDLCAASRAGDAAVFVYSGHGSTLRDDDGDEGTDGRDECLVGNDLVPVRDDDVRRALSGLAAGVNASVLLDCCHASGGSRFFGGAGRARYLPPSMLAARGSQAPRRTRSVERADDTRWVELAACQSSEVAYETPNPDGTVSGAFTRAALGVLGAAGRSLSHAGFMRRVLAAMGPDRTQTPQLRAPDGAGARTLVTRLTA